MLKIKLSILVGAILFGCSSPSQISTERLTIGVVSYGNEARSVDKYEPLQSYLAEQTNSIVELEPAYNELQALEQIQRQRWSLVFAPPGIAAIAIKEGQYLPIFTLEGLGNRERSVLVVKKNSPIEELADLSNKKVALGKPGSATGYYLPLYDLYGLTLAQIFFAPTPKEVLQLIQDGEVEAGALAESEFQAHRFEFETNFRVLRKSRLIPSGVVILSPAIERNQQENISDSMREAPASIVSDAGYVVDSQVPEYEEFIKLVEKVKPLEQRIRQTPAVLTIDN
ncbi:ABC-type phosphate/phosphonate transport system, periplasmic component [Xenococcus sp. PCC 7305]|uniref:phosphate/phosphite/phosphonate ABC transporter substrate-binding protein n=1 Tax=Xenococcus sp. PCC 7305 TaxID=102125 RepID=UPI0002AC1CEA|nr:PhnD/SsuA/transferrin family substrate-binding protein [Xenococcus sp. PCC 7305]ELS05210.1 ABC-type phosphate/phosphonate transport system, periplasmic component [Xenococcus sp. PCC 7305]